MFDLLQKLILARAPCGQEDELRDLLLKELKPLVDELWVDPAGNLVAKITGLDPNISPIRLMAHMDELSLIVKRVNEDETFRVEPLGGILPQSFGQGPVEILCDDDVVTGVLSFGSLHTSKETASTNKMLLKEDKGQELALLWEDVSVLTRRKGGIYPGSRVVIALSRRNLVKFDDAIGGYFLDNRGAIVACILALQKLQGRPLQDVYFVATVQEELGGIGAAYAARTLPGDITLAVDVGPVAREYQTVFSKAPIIVYQDSFGLYDRSVIQDLLSCNISCQRAVFANYGSDASIAKRYGQTAKAALLTFPVANTHGYEVMHKDALDELSSLIAAYLQKRKSSSIFQNKYTIMEQL